MHLNSEYCLEVLEPYIIYLYVCYNIIPVEPQSVTSVCNIITHVSMLL